MDVSYIWHNILHKKSPHMKHLWAKGWVFKYIKFNIPGSATY